MFLPITVVFIVLTISRSNMDSHNLTGHWWIKEAQGEMHEIVPGEGIFIQPPMTCPGDFQSSLHQIHPDSSKNDYLEVNGWVKKASGWFDEMK